MSDKPPDSPSAEQKPLALRVTLDGVEIKPWSYNPFAEEWPPKWRPVGPADNSAPKPENK